MDWVDYFEITGTARQRVRIRLTDVEGYGGTGMYELFAPGIDPLLSGNLETGLDVDETITLPMDAVYSFAVFGNAGIMRNTVERLDM